MWLVELSERGYNFHVVELQNYPIRGCGVLVPDMNVPTSANIHQIRDWLRTEDPVLLDPRALADIRAKLRAAHPFLWNQPIEAAEINGKVHVFNGHHRLTAAVEEGYTGQIPITEIPPPVDFVPGQDFGSFGGP